MMISHERFQRLYICFSILLVITITGGTRAISGTSTPGDRDKTLVEEGHVIHNVGTLHSQVTNWGRIGTTRDYYANFATFPSGRWPGPDGDDLLTAAGFWVGGLINGEPYVTTGYPGRELNPSDAAADTIYSTKWARASQHRYPLPFADDDGDGFEDEDPINGLDDDNDGLIDEDGAGISDQHFRCRMDDLTAVPYRHHPMGLEIIQDSYQWTHPDADDFIGFTFTVTNIGEQTIEDVHLGFYSDFSVGLRYPPHPLERFGHFHGPVTSSTGEIVDIEFSFLYEYRDPVTVESYIGMMILDHPIDPTGESGPVDTSLFEFCLFNIAGLYDEGAKPDDDEDRYDAMSGGFHAWNSGGGADRLILHSTDSFAHLNPGEELFLDAVIVAGADLEDLKVNAANAFIVHRGQSYDRDENPETGIDGKEYHVKWLGPDDITSNSYLHGYVTNNSLDNAPVSDAVVSLDGSIRRVTTDSDGYYFIRAEQGQYDLTISHNSIGTINESAVVFLEGELQTQDVSLIDGVGPFFANTTIYPHTDNTDGPYLINATITDHSGIYDACLYYTSSFNGGPFRVPLVVDKGVVQAEIPGQPAGTLVQYWFWSEDTFGNIRTSPADAPWDINQFQIGVPLTVCLHDDFETDQDWEVGSSDDTATSGIWERADPNLISEDVFDYQPEDDHTPGEGTMCYVTGNDPAGSLPGTDDVDGGKTTLLSPWINTSAVQRHQLSYYRWFSSTGEPPRNDFLKVEVTDDGLNWTVLDSTAWSARMWLARSYDLTDYFDDPSQIRIRVVAEDSDPESLVEAALDDITLAGLSIPQDFEDPVVNLISPSAGDVVSHGAILTWNAEDDFGVVEVEIRLSVDGSAFTEVLFRGPANGSWQWNDQDFTSDNCQLKITVWDSEQHSSYWVSEGTFSVVGSVTGPDYLFDLAQNHPNPFNSNTTINFSLPTQQKAVLNIFDVRGRMVKTLVSGILNAGPNEIEWDGTDNNGHVVAAGSYFYKLASGTSSETRKMLFVK